MRANVQGYLSTLVLYSPDHAGLLPEVRLETDFVEKLRTMVRMVRPLSAGSRSLP